MDPFTLLTLFSAGLSLVGGIAQADSASREAANNAAELERSAKQAERARLDAIRRGSMAESQRRMEVGRTLAAQQVGYTAAGIDASTGTAAAVADASSRLGELDALTIRANAMREAFGHAETARGLRLRAKNVREKGSADVFNIALGTAGNVAQTVAPLIKKKGA